MKNVLLAAVAVATLSVVAMADGLEVGSSVGAFYVNDVTGPSAGKKLCYRCQYGNRPVVSIFARNVDDNVASLIKQVDGVVAKNDKMAGFVVLLSEDPQSDAGKLKQVAQTQSVKNVPLTTFDGAAGPNSYKIAQDADVTVMMWVDGQLKVNKAFKAGELSQDAIPGIVGETKTILN